MKMSLSPEYRQDLSLSRTLPSSSREAVILMKVFFEIPCHLMVTHKIWMGASLDGPTGSSVDWDNWELVGKWVGR